MGAPAHESRLWELVTALRRQVQHSPPEFVREALERLEVSYNDIIEYVHFDSKLYGRTPLIEEDSFSIFVMTWLPGQLTPIHDHRGSACAVRVVRGTCSEIEFERAACGSIVPKRVSKAGVGSVLYSFDDDIHQVGNLEALGELVTIHCYSPPLSQMQWYSLDSTCFAQHEETLASARARS